ncbi:WD40 repeat domain-containing protein [Flaviaesturariibacter terrae]
MNRKRWGLLGLLAALIALVAGARYGCSAPKKIESGLYNINRIYTGSRAEIWTARFGPGDTLIAAACVDSSLRVWHRDGRLLGTLRTLAGLTCAAWSPDGTRLAATAYDGAVYLWSWPEARLLQRFPTHTGTAWTLRFSPDGMLVASAGEDATIVLRSVQSGTVQRSLRGHRLNVWDIAFSPDGRTLASGSFDSHMCLWNVADGRLLRTFSGHSEAVVALAFSPNGRLLATCSDDKTVQVQETGSGRVLQTLRTPEHQQGLSFSPDGRRLLTCGRDKNMMGELVQNFFGDETSNKGVSARLWDIESGQILQTFSAHANDANDVDFSSDGKWFVSAGADKKVILWKAKD